MNGYELRENWRDESGCNMITSGMNRQKITEILGVDYIVFVVKRLIKVDNQLIIMDTKIRAEMNECIELKDSQGNIGNFQLICVVHHMGNVFGKDTTHGHYCADVKNVLDGNWYRTSDSNNPVIVMDKGLTDNGYIFLLKRISNQSGNFEIDPVNKLRRCSTDDVRNLVLSQLDKL